MSDDSSGRICPVCDSRVPAGAAFCISCGSRLTQQTVALRETGPDAASGGFTLPDPEQPAALPTYQPFPQAAVPSSYQQPTYPPQAYQQPSYPPQAYQQPGYPPQAYQQPGYPPQAYQQPSYPPQPYQQPGQFYQPGLPPQPYQQPGYPPQPYQQPGFSTQQGYGQQINVVVNTNAQTSSTPLPQPTVSRVVTIAPRKSVGLAFLLALFFGPLAFFYVQSPGKALVNLLINFVLGVITAGVWFALYYLISLAFVPHLAGEHNRRTIVIR
jgi:hypothetical protein